MVEQIKAWNPFQDKIFENGRSLSSTEAVTRAIEKIEYKFGGDGLTTLLALKKSLTRADGVTPTGRVGNQFASADVEIFADRMRTMKIEPGQDVRDGMAKALGAGNFATLRVYNNLAAEITRMDRVTQFSDPKQAKAVETVRTGLKHAGHHFATPVIHDLIDTDTAKRIMKGAQDEEAKLKAQGHPFPRAEGMVQSLAHEVGTLKVAALKTAETARLAVKAEAHHPQRRESQVNAAMEKWENARQAAQPLVIAGKPLGEVVKRMKDVRADYPELLRAVSGQKPIESTDKADPLAHLRGSLPRPATHPKPSRRLN